MIHVVDDCNEPFQCTIGTSLLFITSYTRAAARICIALMVIKCTQTPYQRAIIPGRHPAVFPPRVSCWNERKRRFFPTGKERLNKPNAGYSVQIRTDVGDDRFHSCGIAPFTLTKQPLVSRSRRALNSLSTMLI